MIINHLKTETMAHIVYSPQLRDRIERFMDEMNCFPVGPNDWKAVASNIMRHHAEHEVTDEVIMSEIEIFCNA